MTHLMLSRRRLMGCAVAAGAIPALPVWAQALDPGEIGRAVAALYDPAATESSRAAFWRDRLSEAGRERTPLDEFKARTASVAALTGGVEFLEGRAAPGQLRLKIRSRGRGVSRWIRVRTDRNQPDRLLDVASNPSPGPYDREGPTDPVTRVELAGEIERRVRYAVANDEFSGAVMVTAPDGTVLWQGAFGIADQATGRPNDLDTRFHIGSSDKSFTALMIGRLVHDGRLAFDTPLIEALPDYPNAEFARACTIDHLLTHSSGLGGLFERTGFDVRKPFTRMADLFPAFAAEPPRFAPGAGQGYSNEGFIVLGAVIEAKTGQSWYDLLAEQIYAPARMTRSGHFRGGEAVENRANGYKFANDDDLGLGERRLNDDIIGYRGNSCGGGYSTVGDMTLYLRALRSGALLEPATVEALRTPQAGGLTGYARGFFVKSVAGRTTVGHGGGGPHSGIDGDHAIVWETGWTLSILGNYDAPFAGDISRDIMRWLAVQDG